MIKELIIKWLEELEEKAKETPNQFDDFAVKVLKALFTALL